MQINGNLIKERCIFIKMYYVKANNKVKVINFLRFL